MTADAESASGRRTGKSEAAFRTISEVAEDLDVPQHVLRFWESKFPQVKPLKRGGGRRYYRPEDVALLRRIRDLLYSEGYTIKGVQKLLREGGAKDVVAAAKAQAELALPLIDTAAPDGGDSDDVDIDGLEDGEEGGEEADFELPDEDEPAAAPDLPAMVPPAPVAPAAALPSAAIGPSVRQELYEILDELEQLRLLLQPR
ncbi:MerR family transcriptional regulator [Magnetospirillum moscoviense]|uniref:Transcriptional regulator n=1 Tax=Magnetospirillum moscoviense TaxID=1437059 RepID=A0A178MPV6_9PROT|nr:MerR family transcriptional regulator [Magnetospirillum moscoviense]OAN50631.1 transcriptional regulator [Magnetospirillum moscoviense]